MACPRLPSGVAAGTGWSPWGCGLCGVHGVPRRARAARGSGGQCPGNGAAGGAVRPEPLLQLKRAGPGRAGVGVCASPLANDRDGAAWREMAEQVELRRSLFSWR